MKTEQQVREEMRATPAGRLLVRCGFEPYDTESSARRVAERAAMDREEIVAAVEKLTDAIHSVQDWDGTYVGECIDYLDFVIHPHENSDK